MVEAELGGQSSASTGRREFCHCLDFLARSVEVTEKCDLHKLVPDLRRDLEVQNLGARSLLCRRVFFCGDLATFSFFFRFEVVKLW